MKLGSISGSLNIALFFAFWLSLLRPGVRVLEAMLGVEFSGGMPNSDLSLLHALTDFFVPALILYFLLRVAPVERWVKVSELAQTQLLLANALIALFYIAGIAGDKSNGIIYWLFLGLPAAGVSLSAVITLLYQSASKTVADGIANRPRVSSVEIKSALVIASAAFVFLGGPVFLSTSSGFQLVTANQNWMKEKCLTAGLTVDRPFSGPLFIEDSMNYVPGSWTLPESSGFKYPAMHRLLVDKAGISQAEWGYHDKRTKTKKALVYRKGLAEYERMESATAKYAIRAKSIIEKGVSDERKLYGGEVTIVELSSDRPVATLRYYASAHPRLACGQYPGAVDLADFVRQASAS